MKPRTTKDKLTEGTLVLLLWMALLLTPWSCAVTNTQYQAIGVALGVAYGLGMAGDIQTQLDRVALEDEVAQAALDLEN
jgi:hypothetical protein